MRGEIGDLCRHPSVVQDGRRYFRSIQIVFGNTVHAIDVLNRQHTLVCHTVLRMHRLRDSPTVLVQDAAHCACSGATYVMQTETCARCLQCFALEMNRGGRGRSF